MCNQECNLALSDAENQCRSMSSWPWLRYFFGFPTLWAVENMYSTVSMSLA